MITDMGSRRVRRSHETSPPSISRASPCRLYQTRRRILAIWPAQMLFEAIYCRDYANFDPNRFVATFAQAILSPLHFGYACALDCRWPCHFPYGNHKSVGPFLSWFDSEPPGALASSNCHRNAIIGTAASALGVLKGPWDVCDPSRHIVILERQ